MQLCSSPYSCLRVGQLDRLSSPTRPLPRHNTPGSFSSLSLHQGWQCPESQAPLPPWKCPAVLWLRAGVTLRWGGMLCVGAYVIDCIILFILFIYGYLLYFQDFNKCQFHSSSSLFCCCWSNEQLLLNALWAMLLTMWDFVLGLKVELTQFAHQSLFTGLWK